MADSARARRLAKRIVTIVATELQHQVKDPRLAMVTVTAATVTPDLREATVFYTVYGDEGEITGTAAALASATGVLRSAVGQQTGIKFTPTLAFRLDTVPENAYRINELLAAARSADAEVAERAAGASYAGEPDPYRVPRVESDSDTVDDSNTVDDRETDDDSDPDDSDPDDSDGRTADDDLDHGPDDDSGDASGTGRYGASDEFDDPRGAATHQVR